MTGTLLDSSLGHLACSIPGATALFHQHQLDFCCGGRKTLRAAAGSLGLDAEALALALAALQDQSTGTERDWRRASADELIDHIMERYHERLRQQLPELIRLARRVEVVHADRPECPHGLADHLEQMWLDLDSHLEKEEQVLFPLLRQGLQPFAQGPIGAMRMEHDGHGDALARMVALAHGLVMPHGACNTWQALVRGLQTLRADLMQHIHLENNLLFEGLNQATAGCAATGQACSCSAI